MNQLKALFFFVLSICSLHTAAQRIKGSDTVLPVSQETAEIFMNTHPEQRVTVTGGGTGVGISALMDHTTDIAMASRPIKFSEKMKLKAAGQEVKEVIIAYDALAIIVHPDNPVSRLRGGLAYTSAKHGLLGLTRQMSLDHGRTGVRINAVLPGPIATDMIARVLAIPQHPVTMKIGMSPAKRPGEPIEVAQAIAFLASDEASFIHGAALAVDGGYTIF